MRKRALRAPAPSRRSAALAPGRKREGACPQRRPGRLPAGLEGPRQGCALPPQRQHHQPDAEGHRRLPRLRHHRQPRRQGPPGRHPRHADRRLTLARGPVPAPAGTGPLPLFLLRPRNTETGPLARVPVLGATREAACGGRAKGRDFPRIRAGPASRALAGRRHNNNPLRASLNASHFTAPACQQALPLSRPSASRRPAPALGAFAPSLAFAGALLPGRAGRGAPAPALRRLNTERRLAPPTHCARQKPASRVSGRSRSATASASGFALQPPLRGSLDASRVRGGGRLRRRLKTGSAPRLRLGLRPLHQLLPSQAAVARSLDVSAARHDGGAWCSLRVALHGVACQQALPLSRPAASRRRRPALGAFGLRPRLTTTASRLAGRFARAWRRPASPAPGNRLRASPSAPASTSSAFAPFASCGRKKPRRLRCASRRRCLALASRCASRRPPANRRCHSRGLWPLGGPPLRSAPSAPSLAFASALLSGRAERGAPVPAVRHLNTETRCARRWTLALCDGLALQPPASRLAGCFAVALRRPALPRLETASAPRLRLGLRRLRLLLPSQASVARSLDVSAARRDGGAWSLCPRSRLSLAFSRCWLVQALLVGAPFPALRCRENIAACARSR